METGNVMVDAGAAFARSQWRRRRARVASWLRPGGRRAGRLAFLECELGSRLPVRRRRMGLRAIPVESIVGTAEISKARSFDAGFLPPPSSRRRWEALWVAARRGQPLPPVAVYRLGDCHYVQDGHHRVSVARALGMAAIDAEVTEIRVVSL